MVYGECCMVYDVWCVVYGACFFFFSVYVDYYVWFDVLCMVHPCYQSLFVYVHF